MKTSKLIFQLLIAIVLAIVLFLVIFITIDMFEIIKIQEKYSLLKNFSNDEEILRKEDKNSNNLKNTNELENYSKKDIKKLLEKSNNIKNYECDYQFSGENINVKYNGNILINKMKNGTIYSDYNKKESFIIVEEKKEAIKVDFDTIVNNNILKNKQETFLEVLEDLKYEYKGITKEKYNGYNCIVVNIEYIYEEEQGFSFEEDLSQYNGEKINIKIWIDQEFGVIMKEMSKVKEKEEIWEYNYTINKLKDEDFNLLLEEYRIIEN